jgi:DNA-binding transcriptional LysR family regulator
MRVTVKVQGPFATNNSESLRDAVLAGLGVALTAGF